MKLVLTKTLGLLTMHLDESTFQKTGLSGQSINIGHQTVWRESLDFEVGF